MNEQWKTDGQCVLCRRADYCKKDCSAYKRRYAKIYQKALEDTLKKMKPKD